MNSNPIVGLVSITIYLFVLAVVLLISCLVLILSPVTPKGSCYRTLNIYFKAMWYFWIDIEDLMSSGELGSRAVNFFKNLNN